MDASDSSTSYLDLQSPAASRTWHRLLLVCLGILVFGTNLGATRLWDVDEAIFSQTAVEMMQRRDLVTPYYNGQLFSHKPPLMYWCQIAAFHVFGQTEFAARLFSALFCIGTLLVTYELGCTLFNQRTGLWAGLALGGCINFIVIARAATPDAHLTFFCTLALLILVRGTRNPAVVCWQPMLPPQWLTYAAAYACMALATLVKGPVGIVIPMAVWGMFLLIEQDLVARRKLRGNLPVAFAEGIASPSRFQSCLQWATWFLRLFWPSNFLLTVWRMRPITAIVAVLVVAGPWYYLVGIRTNGAFLREFFLVQNLGRASQVMESHRGPFFYYLIAVCIGTFPWCTLIWPAMLYVTRSIRRDEPARAGYVLISCWACVWIGCLSVVATKLSSFIFPAYPAIALGFAALVDALLRKEANLPVVIWLRRAWRTIAFVGVTALVALPIVMRLLFDGENAPILLGLIPLIAAVVGWRYSESGQIPRAIGTLAVLGAVFGVTTLGFAVLPIDAHKNTHLFAASIQDNSPGTPHVATYKYSPPSLVFYSQIAFDRLRSRNDVARHFQDYPVGAFLLTTEKQVAELTDYLPGDLVVLRTERLFLKQDNVVLLCRRTPVGESRQTLASHSTQHPLR
ncbi:MAG: glycosyl transferase family 39 [Planctomycetaceae bacterium]|nr:glycosyl transferase family 39 [Planctomycetaceae bacterium]